MAEKSSPDSITLTYDLLKWAIPALTKFPRNERFLLGNRIENHTLDVLELLICANYSNDKLGWQRVVFLPRATVITRDDKFPDLIRISEQRLVGALRADRAAIFGSGSSLDVPFAPRLP